jgi:hypothetical protein
MVRRFGLVTAPGATIASAFYAALLRPPYQWITPQAMRAPPPLSGAGESE